MQQVASETTRVYNRPQPQAANRQQQAPNPPATPFAQMLDDAQAASDPQNQPPANDNTSAAPTDANQPAPASQPTQRADAGEPVGKDGKPIVKTGFKSVAKGDTTAAITAATASTPTLPADPTLQVAQTDKPVTTTKTPGKTVKVETKSDEQQKDTGPNDSKTADATPDPTQAQPVDQPVPVKAAGAPAAVVPTVTAPLAPIADTNAASVPTPDALAALQANGGKTAAVLTAKTSATASGTAKSLSATTETTETETTHTHATANDADRPSATAPNFDTLMTDASAAKTLPDITLPPALSTQAQTNSAAPQNAAAAAAQQNVPAAAIPLSGVAVEIATRAADGKNQFDIRLDPPELGRIEVHLNVDHDGNVSARMIVDRADTLSLLQRDASGLQNALQDAGLKTSDNGLQFSLRDQSAYQQNQQQQQQTSNGGNTAQLVVTDDTLPPDVTQRSYGRLAGLGGGLDIQV